MIDRKINECYIFFIVEVGYMRGLVFLCELVMFVKNLMVGIKIWFF